MIYIILIIIIIIITPLLQIYLIRRRLKSSVGYLVITTNEDGKKLFSLELAKNPDEIENMKYIVFKVAKEATEDLD